MSRDSEREWRQREIEKTEKGAEITLWNYRGTELGGGGDKARSRDEPKGRQRHAKENGERSEERGEPKGRQRDAKESGEMETETEIRLWNYRGTELEGRNKARSRD